MRISCIKAAAGGVFLFIFHSGAQASALPHDNTAPIVSVSLGLPATFLFGGDARSDKAVRIPLVHGDVVVWGGADRLRFHGVAPLKDGGHELLGSQRLNLTFRKAQ